MTSVPVPTAVLRVTAATVPDAPLGCPPDVWASANAQSKPGHFPNAWYQECVQHPEPEVGVDDDGEPIAADLRKHDDWDEAHIYVGEDGLLACADSFDGLCCMQCTIAKEAEAYDEVDPVWWTSAAHAALVQP